MRAPVVAFFFFSINKRIPGYDRLTYQFHATSYVIDYNFMI